MIRPQLNPPSPLQRHHDLKSFESGDSELDSWLLDFAWANHRSGNTRVFVTAGDDRVVGFYALATAGVERAGAPPELTKGGVPTQIPCILLARLAVDRSVAGRGIGRGLVVDAIRRTVGIAEEAGVRALLIHTKNDEARRFYEHLGEFSRSPTDPLHLFLHLKHARRLLRSDEA